MNIPPMPPRDGRPAGDRCEVTLRDTFAAAALTGLLCNGDFSMESIPSHAFSMADAMLRERERTNLDAVPEARAETSVKEPMVHATGEPGGEPEGKIGTGNTWSPLWNPKHSEILPKAVIGIAWVESTRSHIIKMGDGKTAWIDLPLLSPLSKDATPMAGSDDSHSEDGRVRASASSIGNTQEPVAWAVADPEGRLRVLSFARDDAFMERKSASEKVFPLYRNPQPTLTAEEREAVEKSWKWATTLRDGGHIAATLRKLLERLGGGR